MRYLLDTNVVSELRKVRLGKADACVATWADSVDAADLYLSVITVQELEIGVLLAERRDPAQGAIFRTWLNTHVLPAFAGRILSVDTTVALRSGLIAATGLVHGMTVVTRNVADFETTGVMIVNPWCKG